MELALVVVIGVIVLAIVVGVIILGNKLIESNDDSVAQLQQNNDSFKEMARFWSMHAHAHTDLDLEKYKLLVDGTKQDVGDVLPRSSYSQRQVVEPPAEGVTANFGGNDPIS